MPSATECGSCLPRPHHSRPVPPGIGRGRRAPAQRPRPRPAARSPRLCTAWSRRPRRPRRAGRHRRTWRAPRRRPARRRGPGDAAELVGQLPADRAPAVEAQRVLRTLHAERDGPGGDRLAEARGRTGRRAGRRRARAHDRRSRAELTRGVEHPADRPTAGRTRRSASRRARGERGRGERGVAARGDGERRSARRRQAAGARPRRGGAGSRRGGGPCGSGDVVRLVLDPDAAVAVKPSASDRRAGRAERRDREPDAVDRRDGGVELRTRATASASAMPCAVGERLPRRAWPVGTNGFGSSSAATVRRPSVTMRSTWCRSRRGAFGQRHGPTAGDVDARAAHRRSASRRSRPSARPTRALKSSISSSHTPR